MPKQISNNICPWPFFLGYTNYAVTVSYHFHIPYPRFMWPSPASFSLLVSLQCLRPNIHSSFPVGVSNPSWFRGSMFFIQKDELWWYMDCTKLKLLQLDEQDKIGFTYKCMGAAFWAFKQKDFQKALIKVLMAVS